MSFQRVIISVMVCFIFAGFYLNPQASWAKEPKTPWMGQIVSIQGQVLTQRYGNAEWQEINLTDRLFAGDRIRVEANSRAGVMLSNDTVIRLDQNTHLAFTQIKEPDNFFLKLLKGAAHFFSRRPHHLTIATPFVNGLVEGTEFFVRVDDNQTQIDLFEGHLRAVNDLGEINLVKGFGALTMAGQPPVRRMLVDPRDSVQWSLYYPPILAFESKPESDTLKEPMTLYQQGQATMALEAMEKIEPTDRDSRYFVYRAAILLNVGRVAQARQNIVQALSIDTANSQALALEAVIAVVQHRKKDARRSAQKAARISPRLASAQIARSYVEQADFNLPAAIEAAQTAVDNRPQNAIAWARLAELRLSNGQQEMGVRAANKAAALSPNLSHAHTILGFALLTKNNTEKARKAFDQAIKYDTAAPLPRLGRGLAMIREGNLNLGRKEIEIAAGLDPGNALVRSYLGKAYFDEKRDDLDQRQFDIAKGLDPNDPTPWFYDAIRLQSLNRPVEALRGLQKSIELNDNRAVYRSRLLLDDDKAARGVSLARIYDDLGFERRALVESIKSLSLDPSNHSAHRFLSDTYTRLPQHQIAQVSELLQAQLLQPINVNPVQPRLSVTGINTDSDTGHGAAAFNEYTPLFERDRPHLMLAGVAGNNGTLSDEVVLSGTKGIHAYSLGQFHYQTDGFRKDADIEHNIYNIFTQTAVTNKFNVQLEYRRRDTTKGDTRLFLNPNIDPTERRALGQDILRGGMHLSPTPSSDIIASFIYSDRQEEWVDESPSGKIDHIDDRGGFDAEVQYLFHENRFNYLIGGGLYRVDVDRNTTATLEPLPPPFPLPPDAPPLPPDLPPQDPTVERDKVDFKSNGENIYAYGNIVFPKGLVWTLGLSYETYENTSSRTELERVNPKLGIQWDATTKLRFRAAFVENIKRELAVDQTIEPTQVAGFNQFFDDENGTLAQLTGVGIDTTLYDHLYSGLEYTRRDLKEASEREEERYRAYLNWAPHASWSFNAEYVHEKDLLEFELETTYVPLSIRYFNRHGLFGRCGITFVSQEKQTGDKDSLSDGFNIVDALVGYRFPNRLGTISVEVSNLFDEAFHFRDASFKTFDPINYIQPFLPGRTILAKMVFNF